MLSVSLTGLENSDPRTTGTDKAEQWRTARQNSIYSTDGMVVPCAAD